MISSMRHTNPHTLKTCALTLICGLLMSSSFAQIAYPSKPIKIIVPFTPGGVTDILARDISQRLSTRLGQSALAENKAGANGNIGAEMVAKSKGDGYTLLLTAANIAISAALQKKPNYKLFEDLTPITLLAKGPYILVSPANHAIYPSTSFQELIQTAKAHPGKLSMASSGAGSAGHLSGELLQNAANLKFTHIPYKGQTEAMTDILSGQASALFFATVAVVTPHLTDGRINILAVTTKTRSPLLAQTPTISELGYPGFDVSTWHGLFAPKNTPKEIIDKLNSEVVLFFNSTEIQKKYTAQGLQISTSRPEEFGEFLRTEVTQYEKVIKAANLTFD